MRDFDMTAVIGRGQYGKVYLADYDKQKYAIKSIRKDVIIKAEMVANTELEKNIMLECDHPFLIKMDYLFQDKLRLYFVMRYIPGNELWDYFALKDRFSEE